MEPKESKAMALSVQTVRRLPEYYNYLRGLKQTAEKYVAAPAIARELGLNEVQVRKDLAAVSAAPGKPRKGFVVADLLRDIGQFLGYHNREDAILVGAGKLGTALLAYPGFEEHGVRIVAAFDENKDLAGQTVAGKKIFPMEKMLSLCRRLKAQIAIVAVPAENAQGVCDLLVDGGIRAIWNFAPVHLRVPGKVLVRNENLAASLALLSQRMDGEDERA